MPVYMGITNDNAWSDDEPEEVEEVEDVVHEMSDAQITDIATEVLKNFRTMKIDWRKEFPDAVFPAHPAQLDIFNDLMQLNPGKVYMRLESSDVDRKKIWMKPSRCWLSSESTVSSMECSVWDDAG